MQIYIYRERERKQIFLEKKIRKTIKFEFTLNYKLTKLKLIK